MDGSAGLAYFADVMKPTRARNRLACLLVAAAIGLAAVPAQADCLSPQQARSAVAAGEALRLGAIARRVPGDILDAQLCESGGRLVYQLAVMVDGGNVVTIVVDARTGQQLN